ncbi:MAG TPA: bifunctional adenosylcobinamide kinase/adenosylcobinamide-phosphate guanylyltransferase [Pseudonocardiaceae bacterium]
MTHRTLVLGGARSGKSGYAEGLLRDEPAVTYVATARRDPADAEWEARIATHAARRPTRWMTVEPARPGDLATLLTHARAGDPPVLVDDLATWLTGVLDDVGAWAGEGDAAHDVAELVEAVRRCAARLVLVSAEVGLGVVPETRSGRLFRDELGSLNTSLARTCDEVLLLVAGIPLRLKPPDPATPEVGR